MCAGNADQGSRDPAAGLRATTGLLEDAMLLV